MNLASNHSHPYQVGCSKLVCNNLRNLCHSDAKRARVVSSVQLAVYDMRHNTSSVSLQRNSSVQDNRADYSPLLSGTSRHAAPVVGQHDELIQLWMSRRA